MEKCAGNSLVAMPLTASFTLAERETFLSIEEKKSRGLEVA